MKQTENLIFLILIVCLGACAFFWHQISQLELPQQAPMMPAEQSREAAELAPQGLSIAQLPPVNLGARDVFKLPWKKKDSTPPPKEPVPILSSIVWSRTKPLAVINGEILAKGEIDSTSDFKVESITRDSVQVRRLTNEKTVLLVVDNSGLKK